MLKYDPHPDSSNSLEKDMPRVAYGGLLSRFSCVQKVAVSSPTTGQPTDAQRHGKLMKGELEIVIIPEDSHRLFSGQRTVIRFRLVG